MTSLLITTKEAAKLVGIGEGALKHLAATTPDHPKPIRLVSTHPQRRQFRWPVEALRAFYNNRSALTVEPNKMPELTPARAAELKAKREAAKRKPIAKKRKAAKK